jgi:hypothetical protein
VTVSATEVETCGALLLVDNCVAPGGSSRAWHAPAEETLGQLVL